MNEGGEDQGLGLWEPKTQRKRSKRQHSTHVTETTLTNKGGEDQGSGSWIPQTPRKCSKRQHSALVIGGEIDSPSSSKKRKVISSKLPKGSKKTYKAQVVSQIPKRTKKSQSKSNTPKPSTPKKRKVSKKTCKPQVVSQLPKRTKKSQSKSNTPKPSTPKNRKSYVRRVLSCKRQLFDENSSTANNELGVTYNSIRSYQNELSLSSLCLVEDKQSGPNLSVLFKKKRNARRNPSLHKLLIEARRRPSLHKLLIPFKFKRRKRSKSFIRKKRYFIDFTEEGFTNFFYQQLISRINEIPPSKKNKGRKSNALVINKGSRALVAYKCDVLLDEETSRVWNLLKDEQEHEENDEENKKYWEEIRNQYRLKVESFINCMHAIQGDRRFSPWKGSVLDSVNGVFLTQNVADALSSSAYMNVVANFPVKNQEPIRTNTTFYNLKFDCELKEKNLEEIEGQKANESFKIDDDGTIDGSSSRAEKADPLDVSFGEKESIVKKKRMNKEEKEKLMEKKQQNWDMLRKMYTKGPRHSDHMDSVDWEAVRCAEAGKFAQVISERGQHNVIGKRMQVFLNKLKESDESMDLEWLRYAPPKEVKEYLLTIHGLGLKSVECIRLLALHHRAFPVDINVARIVVRLGWVPIQPLPEWIQLHNLEKFPDANKIQEYLWPRLCTLDQRTLYELHYQLITFGKVFCTKIKPNCNACPLRDNCNYYASALASAKLALPESVHDQQMTVTPNITLFESTFIPKMKELSNTEAKECEPIIEHPTSPKLENTELDEYGVESGEEFFEDDYNDIEDIPTIKLSSEETHSYYPKEFGHDMSKSTALVALHAEATNIPIPKMKNASRLKTERLVYVLPDNHPLLVEYTPRELDDPSPYLLVIWNIGELENSCESTKNNLQDEENNLTVSGTLLIPCRTAMRGRFPLNGTYFQVNEVFVDYASMQHPIDVPRQWLWRLEKRIVYFGTGISAIMRGLSLLQIHYCFWRGFICVRAFDAKTGAPRPISSILHLNTTARLKKGNKDAPVDEE